jgi:hypothetical protein
LRCQPRACLRRRRSRRDQAFLACESPLTINLHIKPIKDYFTYLEKSALKIDIFKGAPAFVLSKSRS